MNVENFSYYLLDTSKLKEIGYQDLQNLIQKYPYCQNLHYLICKKSQIEEHPDFDKWLHLAATYSTDRAYLYQLLMEIDFEKDYSMETIELDELTKENEANGLSLPNHSPEVVLHESREDLLISNTLAALQAQQANSSEPKSVALEDDDEPLSTFSSLLDTSDEIHIEMPAAVAENLIVPTMENGIAPIPIALTEISEEEDDDEGELEDFNTILNRAEQVEENNVQHQDIFGEAEKTNAPLPKTAFSSYKTKTEIPVISDLPFSDEKEMLEHSKRIEEKLATEQEKRKKKEEKKKKEQALISFAEESLVAQEDTGSETLANILALQGHKDKAIAMYEKLKLQIPEKSAFFAAQIEKLKIS
jgi:hypothetical protein